MSKSMDSSIFISPDSVVKNSKLGQGVKIWHFCNIYGCTVGDNTQIGSFSEIKEGARIGKNCRLQSYVFVPEGTIIGNHVFIGPKVTFTNDKYPSAVKAITKDWEMRGVVVGNYAVLGAGAILCPGVKIGERAVVGAGSCVTKDVKPYEIVLGNPARKIGNIKDPKYLEKYREIIVPG